MTPFPKTGDHVVANRNYCGVHYAHHGIVTSVAPAVRVIHYSGFCEAGIRGPVRETDLATFHGGAPWAVRPHRRRRYDGAASVARARQRVGEDAYHIVFNNCEHFVLWCIQGKHSSAQVKAAAVSGVIGAAVAWRIMPRVVQGLGLAGLAGGATVGVGVLGTAAVVAMVSVSALEFTRRGAARQTEVPAASTIAAAIPGG